MFACAPVAHASPTFILTDLGGVGIGTPARAAFETAAAMWSSEFTNNVTIRLDVGFEKFDPGYLALTGSMSTELSYGAVRTALGQGATSASDRSAYASLAPTLSFESNVIAGQAPTAAIHALENNPANADTQLLWANTANAKALGLMSSSDTSLDGSVIFNSAYHYTFDRSQGVAKRTYDFVGLAEHEIAHALGFVSGVDTEDAMISWGMPGLEAGSWGSVLDLFRYQNGQRDWTVGGNPCLSVDGGHTCGAHFATGQDNGDGAQASHWRPGSGLGIMNPSLATGVEPAISANDLQALDVIGWNLSPQAGAANGHVQWATKPNGPPRGSWNQDKELVGVAEPGIAGLLALAVIPLARRRRSSRG